MPIVDHKSFRRPVASTPFWRYTELPKFLDLLTSQNLWLTNLEVLAVDDPYEGAPGPLQFPHRMWKRIEEVPEGFRNQITAHEHGKSPEEAFRLWFMGEEHQCIMTRSGRRDFYVTAGMQLITKSMAMWKINGAPGAGIAIVSNGAKLEASLGSNTEGLYLGAVRYEDPDVIEFGMSNSFDPVLIKSNAYRYEQEMRLVYWDTGDIHDTIGNFNWNDQTMRFDDLIEDQRPLQPGRTISCDIDVLIDRVIVSPFAPPWYLPMIERLRDQLGLKFPISSSKLRAAPTLIP